MNNKKGRPSKYNNPDTLKKLQDLVFLYKKENPSGIIRISHMVRFSKKMNDLNSDVYPFYSKDVWSEYGRTFIDEANEPVRTTISTDEDVSIELPNICDIVQKYSNNQGKLLEYLLPVEQMLHEAMYENRKLKEAKLKQEESVEELKQNKKHLEELVKYYEKFILTMSHDSYRKEFEGMLKNQISVNANERNKNAMRNLDDLGSFFEIEQKKSKEKEDVTNSDIKQPTVLNHWKNIRKS